MHSSFDSSTPASSSADLSKAPSSADEDAADASVSSESHSQLISPAEGKKGKAVPKVLNPHPKRDRGSMASVILDHLQRNAQQSEEFTGAFKDGVKALASTFHLFTWLTASFNRSKGFIADFQVPQSHPSASDRRQPAIARLFELIDRGELDPKHKQPAIKHLRLTKNAEFFNILPPREHVEYLSTLNAS